MSTNKLSPTHQTIGTNGAAPSAPARSNNIILDEALQALSRGWSVFPVSTESKRPLVKWKAFQDEMPTETRVRNWFGADYRHIANLGLATGELSGRVVLDVDELEGLEEIERLGGVPHTQTVQTRPDIAHKLHFHFEHPGFDCPNFAKKFRIGEQEIVLPGLDFRGDGGYVMLPPSRHHSGAGNYEWLRSPDDAPLAPMPEWLFDLLKARFDAAQEEQQPRPILVSVPALPAMSNSNGNRERKYVQAAIEREQAAMNAAGKGMRHEQRRNSAIALGSFVPHLLSEQEVTDALAINFGADKRGAMDTIKDGIAYGRERPRQVPPPRTETHQNAPNSSSHSASNEVPSQSDADEPTAKEVAKPSTPKAEKDKPKSQADALLDIALKEAQVFCNEDDEVFASVEQGNQTLILRVRSMAFRSWLNLRHLEMHNRLATSKGAADAAILVLYGLAKRNPTRDVFSRVVATESAIYYDLADAQGRAVEITADGWKIIERPPVAFYRAKGTRPQVRPQRGGSFELLSEIVNVKSGDLALVAAWLTAFFQPRGPRPHLGIVAEQGSGKSKATSFLRCLLDPNATPTRVASPKDARDLFIAANSNAILAFDNLSYIPGWFSDALCCLATGAGYATRTLYSDDEEKVFSVQRPVIFNAITDVATRPDLLDRTILLELPRVSENERKDEREIDSLFVQNTPLILGAIFDAVAEGLKNLPDTRPENLPRMADFAKWIAACAPAMGESGKNFEFAYRQNRETVTDLVAETSTVLQAVEEWAITREANSEGVIFNDSATELLTLLNKFVDFETTKAPDWPRSAHGLARALQRIKPILRKRGWDVEPSKSRGNRSLKIGHFKAVQ